MGFEPTASTLTGWRALQAAPRGRCFSSVAQVGLECLISSKSALWESNPPCQLGRLEPLPLTASLVRTAGFEPAISCFQSRRNDQAIPRPEKCAQPKSNRHTLHSEQGCHYILVRKILLTKLSKIVRAPGRTRTGVAAVRKRSLRR